MIDVQISLVGLMPEVEKRMRLRGGEIKMAAIPRMDEAVVLPEHFSDGHAEERTLYVRHVGWYPLGHVEDKIDPNPFVYVVLGPNPVGR